MNKELCKQFKKVWEDFPDTLSNKGYDFKDDGVLNNYCQSSQCHSNFDKISAVCLYLFRAFFGSSDLFNSVAKKNIDIVDYILIWLSYMLNLGGSKDHNNIKDFYNYQIVNRDNYNTGIKDVSDYKSYKDLIDRKNYLSMNINIISKFYDPFKSLCNLYNELDDEKTNCKNCSDKANQFVEKYKALNEDSDITDSSPYKEIFSKLSNDYDNLKNECKDDKDSKFPSLTETNTPQDTGQITERTGETGETVQKSDVTSSSSSIVSKLIIALSIFSAITIFLVIFYKCSLFVLRKRAQKQNLREKLKKIKKKMNH
ncbi:uncharacterized protein PY17X_0800031 [Plasmodium yoelii]|uniref:PIR protein n=4 Tax=Plasmodium yoelii TaxID=5861 RepID=A0AAE9WTV1_PLAYO|nr:uncharacterized protein PY17X_0800031 [Plasmodium yoelii]EAA16414.1 putative yir4 protein [Plasmodium yoelii yoelii]WBY56494.1 PIR protein [Plasmodium yoelii yoelii]VTZ76990.1 PIR protein [Plasmodium yoelii]|eukprot:XP_724849.1 uncharacterized protein PY17X_0800031 [Plasmodium yoelii]